MFSSLILGKKASTKGQQKRGWYDLSPLCRRGPWSNRSVAWEVLSSPRLQFPPNSVATEGGKERGLQRRGCFSLAQNIAPESSGSNWAYLLFIRKVAMALLLQTKGEGTGLVEGPQGFTSKKLWETGTAGGKEPLKGVCLCSWGCWLQSLFGNSPRQRKKVILFRVIIKGYRTGYLLNLTNFRDFGKYAQREERRAWMLSGIFGDWGEVLQGSPSWQPPGSSENRWRDCLT